MKKFSFVFWFIAGLFMVTSCSEDIELSTNSSNDEEFNPIVKGPDDIPADAQLEANMLNTSILDRICVQTRSLSDPTVVEQSYPDFFGGSYITKDGDLMILYKGDSLNCVRKIKAIEDNDIIKYKSCDYSYQELLDVMYEIRQCYKMAQPSLQNNLCGFGILDDKNVIEIDLINMDEAAINQFKQLYDHPSLVFVESGRFIDEYTLYPGGVLSIDEQGEYYGSYAFRARETSGQKRTGMVTAGHVRAVGEYAYVSGNIVGECVKSVYAGSVDAAFVAVDDTEHELSNYIASTYNELSTQTSLPGVGTYINKRGARTGSTGGYIKSTNYELTINGVTFTNLTSAEYDSNEGDSGGIIYTYISSTETRYTVGIHKGATNTSGLKVFTKANLALSALGVERY